MELEARVPELVALASHPADQPPVETRYPEILAAYGDVAAAAARQQTLDELLHVVARKACELVGVSRASIYLREDGSGTFRGRVGETFTDVDHDTAVRQLVAGLESDAFTREIVVTGRPVVIRDAARDPRPVRAAMRGWRVCAILGVPMIADGDVVGLIFLDDAGDHHRFTDGDGEAAALFANLAAGPVAQARHVERLRVTATSATRQNELLRRVGALEQQLAALLVDAASLIEVAAAVTKVAGQPCFVHDPDLRRLAAAGLAGPHESLRSVLDFDVDRACVAEVLAAASAKAATLVGPFPRHGVNRRYVVAPIRAGGRVDGYLVLPEATRGLGTADVMLARRAASMIAIGAVARGGHVRVETLAREAVARDLLAGAVDDATFAPRAQQCGFVVDRPHMVVRLRRLDAQAPAIELVDAENALTEAGYAGPHFGVVAPSGGVTLLIEIERDLSRLEGGRRARSLVERAVETLARDGQVVAALSSSCSAADEYAAGAEEAEQVLGCLLSLAVAGGSAVLCADDLGPGRLILSTLDQVGARRFASQTFGALLEQHGMVFLETLGVYFDSCRSVRRAALVLGVHENTIRYRLARLAVIAGLDLDGDPSDQLSGQLAILILRLQGRLTPPVAATTLAAPSAAPLLERSA